MNFLSFHKRIFQSCFGIFIIISFFYPVDIAYCQSEAPSGGWKKKTLLVWNKTGKQLIRKKMRVWDQHPEKGLDFIWESDPNERLSDEILISGRGKLTWRIHGTARYDRRSIYSTYSGEMKKGLRDGKGKFETRDGLTYYGNWKKGLMHGRGKLQLENGDQYDGEFLKGKFHGRGRYASSVRGVYIGHFVNGKRQGQGKLYLGSNKIRTSKWENDKEKTPMSLIKKINYSAENPNTVFISTNQSKYQKISKTFNSEGCDDPRMCEVFINTYNHKIRPDYIEIFSQNKEVRRIWENGGKLKYGFYQFKGPEYDIPVILTVSPSLPQKNNSKKISKLYLNIKNSYTKTRPFLSVSYDEIPPKYAASLEARYGANSNSSGLSPIFSIKNMGWGKVRGMTLSFQLAGNKEKYNKKMHTINVGSFSDSKDVSIIEVLESLGIDVEKLKKHRYKCNISPNPKTIENKKKLKSCQQYFLNQSPLGSLKKHVFFGEYGNDLRINLEGQLNYTWKDSFEKIKKGKSKLTVPILLGRFGLLNLSEGGMGGLEAPKAGFPVFNLALNKKNYEIKYPLTQRNREVSKGFNLTFGLTARKSSNHTFQVVFEFSDGTKQTSKPVHLQYLKPRSPYFLYKGFK